MLPSVLAVKLDTITFDAAISACARMEWEQALHIFNVMERNNFDFNTITVNAAISACEKAVGWQQTLHFVQIARHEGTKA